MNSPKSPRNEDHHWVEQTIEVELGQRVSVGVMLSNEVPPKVTKLMPSSSFLGRLFVGDKILSINGQPIKNFQEMFILCKTGKVTIKLCRDEYCMVKINPLPAPKPGFEAYDLDMKWGLGGMPIGILVYHDSQQQAIVSMIEDGSLASNSLRPGDVLVAVNDAKIEGKDAAKKAILDSVNATNRVKLTIHRQIERDVPSLLQPPPASPGNKPAEPDTKTDKTSNDKTDKTDRSQVLTADTKSDTNRSAIKSVTASVVKPPRPKPKGLPMFDLLLPADVLAIMAANKDFYKNPNPNPPILKNASAPPGAARIDLNGKVEENQIEFEPGPKALRKTPKRVGS
ncbi:unnamed protein product [Bursaphelenchus okinawaensis]|uniref:PDZ domain-containing protein n=1 Tax=Bursaphelenchus okinawaensis TaxID=465554 RepID=A0A811KYS4_9BILA|nr:unnamed protein product [Bursaphelenchus okinawaensis]CAG9113922.1 unnamed protein product [Bursaphelenchus okinawaensis]